MARLAGKVAIVTGASKGIGAGIAQRLAADGASVVVNYSSSAEGAENVVSGIRAKGGKAKAIQADVSKLGDIDRLFKETITEYGKVDVVVNNAGIFKFKPLLEIDESHFDSQYAVNVKGLLFTTQAAVKAFGKNGGAIVNVSSVASKSPFPTGSVYSSTKAAVDAITQSLAGELGPQNIRINSVLRGPVETEGFHAMPGATQVADTFVPQTPMGRIGQPDDVADVVAFLVTEDARWITGQLITTSGGLR
jgi:3-oxoacyl-[acyl-carrier protein] reductase